MLSESLRESRLPLHLLNCRSGVPIRSSPVESLLVRLRVRNIVKFMSNGSTGKVISSQALIMGLCDDLLIEVEGTATDRDGLAGS